MNRMQKLGVALVAASMSLIPSLGNAQAATQFIGTGSSALWQTSAIAAWELTGKAHHYTFKLNAVTNGIPTDGVEDTRNSSDIAYAQGSIWVVWDSSTSPTKVYSGVSLDSTVGDRLFLGTNSSGKPAGKLVLPSTIPAAGNLISVTWGADDATLPAAVIADLNAAPDVTAAFTDIRPEDAAYATARADAAHGTTVVNGAHSYVGLGYNGALSATETDTNWVESSYSSTGFQVVPFNTHGTDPISGETIPAYDVVRVGFSPIVVLVNRTSASGLGSKNSAGKYNFTNLSLPQAAALWSTGTGSTIGVCNTSVFGVSGAPDVALTVNRREPLSGTYNTFEYQAINVPYVAPVTTNPPTDSQTSQENFVVPTATGGNPLDLGCSGSPAGTEKRAIGTSEMVNTAIFAAGTFDPTTDAIGYAFFSFGNVSKIAGSTNFGYLTLGGVDPINATYSTGELPTTGTISSLFSHVKDGTYPAWSDLRIVTNSANETIASGLANQIISDINSGAQLPDFLPYSSSLVLYHSHYASAYCNGTASNGLSGAAENCGDVNGKIFITGNTLQDRN
jgi:hypothetical protein